MRTLFLVLFFVPLIGAAQKKLSLTGKITGAKDGPIVLADLNNPTDTIASGTIKSGSFILKGTLKEPMLVSLILNANQKAVLFLDNANVKITGNVSDLKAVKVTGSSSHAAFDVFQKKFNPLFERLGKLNQLVQMTGSASDSLIKAQSKLNADIQKETDLFIKKYKTSAVSSFLLAITVGLNEDILVTERRLNSLSTAAANNFYGNYLKEIIAEKKVNAIGSVAVDFTQADTLGIPVSLSSFRGKYVLLDFWASWCGPCRQENPNVVSTYNKFKQKNFTVLGVSLDRPGQKEKWLQAIHTDNLTWTHVSDLQFWNNAVAIQYKIQSIPQNFLIGPDGKIVAKNLRGPALESKLCEVLGCN